MIHNFNNEIQHFSIRKLTVGAASVLIGLSFANLNGHNTETVHAATVDNSDNAKAVQTNDSADQEVKQNYQASEGAKTDQASTNVQTDQSVQTNSVKTDTLTNEKAPAATVKSDSSAKIETADRQVAKTNNQMANAEKQSVNDSNVANTDSAQTNAQPASAKTSLAKITKDMQTIKKVDSNYQTFKVSDFGNDSAMALTHLPAGNLNMILLTSLATGSSLPTVTTDDQGNYTIGGETIDPSKLDPNNPHSQDINHDVNFDPENMTTHIMYQLGGRNVSQQDITGLVDNDVKFTPQLPDGYVADQSIPGTIHLTYGMANPTINVKDGNFHIPAGQGHNRGDIIPGTTTRTFVDGVTNNDLNKTIHRIITITTPDTHNADGAIVKGSTQTIDQAETWYRGATIDTVDGHIISYDAWTLKPGSKTDMDAYNPASIAGYTTHTSGQNLNGVNINQLNPSSTQIDGWDQNANSNHVTYTANNQSVNFKFWDDTDNKQVGATVTKNGVTDQTIDPGLSMPVNYKLSANNSIPTSYIMKATNPDVVIHLAHDLQPGKPGQEGVVEHDYQETITRTITPTYPAGHNNAGNNNYSQSVLLTRTFTYDPVTKRAVAWGPWTTGNFSSVTVPQIAGYTTHVSGVTLDSHGNIPNADAVDGFKDPKITITYTANDGQQTIQFKDSTGKVIGTQVIKGKTDQTVNVPNQVPTGWIPTTGVTVPTQVTIKPADTPIDISIEHHDIGFDPQHPIITGQKTSTGQIINGGHAQDLAKTITRSVTIHQPSTYNENDTLVPGDQTPQNTSLSYTRGGHYDDVTGVVTYDDWQAVGAKSMPAINIPVHAGYTASRTDAIPAQTPTNDQINNWTDPKYDVTYSANSTQQTINFVDDSGKVIHTQTITGKTDNVINLTPETPDGWITNTPDEIPGQIILRPSDTPINYKIKHGSYTVKSTDSVKTGDIIPGTKAIKFPAGVTHNDLNVTVHRYIKVNFPKSYNPPYYLVNIMDNNNVIDQSIHFFRDATIDTVTGQITYSGKLAGGWDADNGTGQFPSIYIPHIPGYDMHLTNVASKTASVNAAYLPQTQYLELSLVAKPSSNGQALADSLAEKPADNVANSDTTKSQSDSTAIKSDAKQDQKNDQTKPSIPAKSAQNDSKANAGKSTDLSSSKTNSSTDQQKPAASNSANQSDSKTNTSSSQKPAEKPAQPTATDSQKPANKPAQSGSTTVDKTDSKAPAKSDSTNNNKSDSQTGTQNTTDSQKPAEKPAQSDSANTNKSDSKIPAKSDSTTSNSAAQSGSNTESNNSGLTIGLSNGLVNNNSAVSGSNAANVEHKPAVPTTEPNEPANNTANSNTVASSNNSTGSNTANSSTSVNDSEPNATDEPAMQTDNGAVTSTSAVDNAPAEPVETVSAPASQAMAMTPSYAAITPMATSSAPVETVISNNMLPQTGSMHAEILAALGVAASGLAIIGLAGTRKRHA